MPLDTSSVMFLESSGVSSLSTSYTLLQVTQPGLMRPQLVSSHSHHEALSAALVVLRMALLFLSPSMHKLLKALAKERAANHLHPTSAGRHLALHLAFWQLLTSPVYLESFLSKASSKRSSHGTVSSSSTTCFVVSDTNIVGELSLEVHQQLPVPR